MNNANKILAALAVIQLVLLAVVYAPRDEEANAPGGVLLADYAADQVDEIKLSDDQDHSLTLRKNDAGDWILPDYGDYPVESLKVDNLLNALSGLQGNRLITESSANYRRLKVSEDEYLRRIEVNGENDYVLFVGTSGGGNATHTRLADQDAVYLVGDLASSDANATPDAWVNTTYLSLSPTQVTNVTLQNANGTFEFAREGESWTMSGLADGESLNVGGFENFLNQATLIRLTAPLGKEDQAEYGLENPQATLTLRVERPAAAPASDATAEATAEPPEITEYTLVFGAELETGVVVKSSESEYYVMMSPSSAATFITQTRENFVLAPTPAPTEEATAESTVEPTLEPTVEPTLEATAEATPEAGN